MPINSEISKFHLVSIHPGYRKVSNLSGFYIGSYCMWIPGEDCYDMTTARCSGANACCCILHTLWFVCIVIGEAI